jgi:hypothetical protein
VSRLSLRARLAALIGLMLVVCGAALLAVSYGLVSSNLEAPLPGQVTAPAGGIPEASSAHGGRPEGSGGTGTMTIERHHERGLRIEVRLPPAASQATGRKETQSLAPPSRCASSPGIGFRETREPAR